MRSDTIEYRMSIETGENEITAEQRKKYERNGFVFLAVFLAPILSVAIVGAFGLAVWISQM